MSAIKFKFSIKELNIEFEGEREDLPQVRKDLSNHLTQVMPMPSGLGPVAGPASGPQLNHSLNAADEVKPRKTRSRSSSSASGKKSEVFTFVHDAEMWGTPQQGWNPTRKGLWLLRVLAEVRQVDAYTVGELAANFNKHFKQAGQITASNLSRDFGKVKGTFVTELTNEEPSKWSLMQKGIAEADKLVRLAKGEEVE
jgi:hypothetical protein